MDFHHSVGLSFPALSFQKKCVHEQATHEERNNLIEYKRKKAIIDKLKENHQKIKLDSINEDFV